MNLSTLDKDERVKGGARDKVTIKYLWKLTWENLCIPEVGNPRKEKNCENSNS